MKDELTKEINEAIRKNLPEHLSGELKQIIEQNQQRKEQIECQDETIKENLVNYKKLEEMVNKHKSIDEREAFLSNKEREIGVTERNLKITLLEKDVTLERACNEQLQMFLNNLTNNVVVKKNIVGNIPMAPPEAKDQYGNDRYPTSEDFSKTETITEE